MPSDEVVVEIQETVPPDAGAVEACLRLKEGGYAIALDNFVPGDVREPLVPYADFLKVDTQVVPREQSAALAARYGSKRCWMLAQKVETRESFYAARKGGFTAFQGYFFRRPERMRARQIPARPHTCICCRPSPSLRLTSRKLKNSSSTNRLCAIGCCAT